MNQITNGVNELNSDLAGRTVGQVRSMLSQVLNIDPAAVPMVDGEQVGEEYVLADGDDLEFVKAAGTKG